MKIMQINIFFSFKFSIWNPFEIMHDDKVRCDAEKWKLAAILENICACPCIRDQEMRFKSPAAMTQIHNHFHLLLSVWIDVFLGFEHLIVVINWIMIYEFETCFWKQGKQFFAQIFSISTHNCLAYFMNFTKTLNDQFKNKALESRTNISNNIRAKRSAGVNANTISYIPHKGKKIGPDFFTSFQYWMLWTIDTGERE